jgi:L,D-transpeptidase ErfK/SrfK
MKRVIAALLSTVIFPFCLVITAPAIALGEQARLGWGAPPDGQAELDDGLDEQADEERALAEQRKFIYPLSTDDVVGWLRSVEVVEAEDTLVDIGRRYKFGFDAIKAANPEVDPWLPPTGTKITLPGKYVLPDAPRRGIVINVSEKRLYYYPRAASEQAATVEVYAVSVGRGDWGTPLKTTRVTGMVKHPTWYPPASVRAEHAQRGDVLPAQVPWGPDNPLGDYVISLAMPSYFIHGTNRENGVGMQVTHGCIRMYPVDIDRLANSIPTQTPVHIVNQRYKAGWKDGVLYLEAHPPLEGVGESEDLGSRSLTATLTAIRLVSPNAFIDWAEVWNVQRGQLGVPMPVGEWRDG